ncbi:hypothetical protein B7494_g2164 [Chlorociboria aeruginascens]|nr:hypothetical protein B7494_g2164 [Chlorociboria aeruginascens]
MAPPQAMPNTRKVGRPPAIQRDKGERPQGTRRSARLAQAFPPAEERKRKRKRKRSQDGEPPLLSIATSSQKRPRASPRRSPIQHRVGENPAVGLSGKKTNPVEYWRQELHWPQEYFEPESNMVNPLAKKKSSLYFHEKTGTATPSPATPSDQKPREVKSAPYTRPSYETILATKGSFMGKFELSITDESKRLCQTVLAAEQSVPQDTLFRDDLFDETCESVRARNEAMVVRDISPLICPSAQVLRIYGAKHLKPLNESVNEGWNSAIPFFGPRPQPDYSVGFGRSAFTDYQLEKLEPFVGNIADICTSYFMATWQMYFPFLTCEVKCGTAALDVADRQNAHSMTLAVRGIVELFRLVKREKELHREILAFSISHDHQTIKIYGHYPIIDGKKTTFYRHPIKKFLFTDEEGKDKWTSYKFTKNLYDIWMPTHLKRICSVIDKLPSDINFEVSAQSEPGESGLPQGLESPFFSSQSSYDAAFLEEADSQSSGVGSRDITSDTSLSRRIDGRSFKKSRKRGRPVELQQDGKID